MKEVKLGVIGVGNMGSGHANLALKGEIKGARLAAVCDIDPARLERFKGDTTVFEDSREMIRSGVVNAVVIATPHYAHTTIGIDALEQGLHVLVEKPISVHKADCERLIAAHRKRRQVFAAMFNQRTDPHYSKVKQLIDDGELGKITRVNWIITHWFRTQAYYDSGTWRATWAGEGGGVLLNQSPHQLDMLQWLCGMPSEVRADCSIGKYHDIEVEDEVTAYLKYANGATGVFISSTGEAPGTNRLEVCGERGKVVVEDNKILFTRNTTPMSEHSRTCQQSFKTPDVWNVEIPVRGGGGQHKEVLNNFASAILHRTPLIAPAREGINSVELGNAMLLSSLTGKTIQMPMNGKTFERRLKQLIKDAKPRKKKKSKGAVVQDMSSSF